MSFYEIRFPAKIGLKATSSPEWNTEIITRKSGFETANKLYSAPLYRFSFPVICEQAEIGEILSFHRAISQGRANRFRFKDWNDFGATDQHNFTRPTIGTGDNSTTTFQLIKTYNFAGFTINRTITKPVHDGVPTNDGRNTVKIYVDDVLQTSGWSVNAATGVVTFDTAPSSGDTITAEFEFDVPCRMDVEGLPLTPIRHTQLNRAVEISNLEVMEVRV